MSAALHTHVSCEVWALHTHVSGTAHPCQLRGLGTAHPCQRHCTPMSVALHTHVSGTAHPCQLRGLGTAHPCQRLSGRARFLDAPGEGGRGPPGGSFQHLQPVFAFLASTKAYTPHLHKGADCLVHISWRGSLQPCSIWTPWGAQFGPHTPTTYRARAVCARPTLQHSQRVQPSLQNTPIASNPPCRAHPLPPTLSIEHIQRVQCLQLSLQNMSCMSSAPNPPYNTQRVRPRSAHVCVCPASKHVTRALACLLVSQAG